MMACNRCLATWGPCSRGESHTYSELDPIWPMKCQVQAIVRTLLMRSPRYMVTCVVQETVAHGELGIDISMINWWPVYHGILIPNYQEKLGTRDRMTEGPI